MSAGQAQASTRLVADVGGTNTRLALFNPGTNRLESVEHYTNREFEHFDQVDKSHTYQLEPGQVALLATDGIEPDVAGGLEGDEIAALLTADAPLVERVDALLTRADDVRQGGGADNLGVVALQG